MPTINLKDAKAGFSGLADETIKGECVTITRRGKPVAALVSVEAAGSRARRWRGPVRASSPTSGRFRAQNSSVTGRLREMSRFERMSARRQCRLDAVAFEDRGFSAMSRMAGAHGP
jgi:prevent-host-death family protein